LIVKIAPPVVANKMGADILVAGRFSGFGLMLETTQECFCDALLEVDTRIISYNFLPKIFGELLTRCPERQAQRRYRATQPQ
jgi:hypothetical protein